MSYSQNNKVLKDISLTRFQILTRYIEKLYNKID